MTILQIAAALEIGGFGFDESIAIAKGSGAKVPSLREQLHIARTAQELQRRRAEALEEIIGQIEREP
jgi:hypothetical protein